MPILYIIRIYIARQLKLRMILLMLLKFQKLGVIDRDIAQNPLFRVTHPILLPLFQRKICVNEKCNFGASKLHRCALFSASA